MSVGFDIWRTSADIRDNGKRQIMGIRPWAGQLQSHETKLFRLKKKRSIHTSSQEGYP
jgi:hypothetical protein